MRVAVVDDNAADRLWLAGELKSLMARRGQEGAVAVFSCGEDFLAAAGKERFDLAFLDIYMEGMGGVEAARRLREFDAACLLAFSTVSRDHALEGYQVRAVQYLVKPYDASALEQLFNEIDRLLPLREKYVVLRAGRQSVRLRLGDVLWAEHFQHQVRVHTAGGGVLSTRLTFGEFTALLASDSRFFVCGRGLLVNLDHAADFDGRDFRMDDGARLPVSRDLAGAARGAFGDRVFYVKRGPEA